MSIQRIQNVYVVVRDMSAMLSFYRDVLGTPPKFKDEERWTQFGVGGSNFALASQEEAAPGAAGAVVVFEATSLEGVRATVEQAGGRWTEDRDMGSHGQVLTFLDPEGRAFQVFSKTAPTTPQTGS